MSYKILMWKHEKNQYAAYWNDGTVESVSNNIKKGEFSELEFHIKKQGLMMDLNNCIAFLKRKGKDIAGVGADLASGSMWLTAYIIKNYSSKISRFYSIDYSEQYVLELGPSLLKHYEIKPDNLTLCLGSFYELQLPSNSLDFIVMSQAFHHADNPDKLLKEVYRVLKEDGFLIMIGELYISKKLYFKCYLNYLISRLVSSSYFPPFLFQVCGRIRRFKKKNLRGKFQDLYFPPDPLLGDYYHLKSQYENFFKRNDFNFWNVKSQQNNHLAYLIYK